MSTDDATNFEQPFADALAALDAQLERGESPDSIPQFDASADQQALFSLARDSLLRLERACPRSTGKGSEPRSQEEPSFDLLSGTGRIGKFQIHRELGRGGSGIVFFATDTTTGRDVALKLPRFEALLDPALRQRFINEARFTTSLDHPALVTVYEAGEVGAVCYIASAYAGETTLQDWLESRLEPVPARTAAALVVALARGVEYLHEHHILHRDIKPSNVVLGKLPTGGVPSPELVSAGAPRLTDFGLARLLDAETAGTVSNATTGGLVLGTPEYMAPEQADARPEALGRWTDLYGLGAVLYELLTGHPPFRGRNKFDTLTSVLSEQPKRLRCHRPDVPRDLEAVCLKCLEKEPHRRYATAGQLAEDLQRFLAGRRTHAKMTSLWRRTWRWGKRRPFAAAIAIALAVAVPSLIGTWLGFQKYREAAAADKSQRRISAWEARQKGVDLCNRGDLGIGLLWLSRGLTAAGEDDTALGELLRFDIAAWSPRLPELTATLVHPARVSSVEFSPDGNKVLTLCQDNLARFWDAETGKLLEPALTHPTNVLQARFASDGQSVRTAGSDGVFRTWSTTNHELLRTDVARDVPVDTPSRKAGILWEFETGGVPAVKSKEGDAVWLLQFAPDRRTILSLSYGNAARLWDATRREPIGKVLFHPPDLWAGALSPDGQQFVTAGSDRRVRCWDAASQQEIGPPLEHSSPIRSVAFHPSKPWLAAGDMDAIRLWDMASRETLCAIPRQSAVRTLAFSRDGRRLGSGSGECCVRLWKVPLGPRAPLLHRPLSLGGTHAPEELLELSKRVCGVLAVAASTDGREIFTVGGDPSVQVWNAVSGERIGTRFGHQDLVTCIAVGPDGQTVLTGSRDRSARLWNPVSGAPLAQPFIHGQWLGSVAVAPDGVSMATGTLDTDKVRLWNARTGACTAEVGPIRGVFDLAFSPDGRQLVAATMTGALWWDWQSNQCHSLEHNDSVFAVAFHPGGHAFVTGSGNGELRWWDVKSLQCQATVSAHRDRVKRAAFSPDGKLIVTVGWDSKLRFWHGQSFRQTGPAVELPGVGQTVAFLADGTAALAGCKTGTVEFAAAPRMTRPSPRQLLLWVQVITGLELEESGQARSLTLAEWQERRRQLRIEGGPPA